MFPPPKTPRKTMKHRSRVLNLTQAEQESMRKNGRNIPETFNFTNMEMEEMPLKNFKPNFTPELPRGVPRTPNRPTRNIFGKPGRFPSSPNTQRSLGSPYSPGSPSSPRRKTRKARK